MSPLLLPETLNQFNNVLDAPMFKHPDPDKLALVEVRAGQEDIKLSQYDFVTRAREIAKALSANRVGQRDIVLIAVDSIAETSLCFWATLLLGAIPLVYPTKTPKMLLDYYLKQLHSLLDQVSIHTVISNEKIILREERHQNIFCTTFEELSASVPIDYELPVIKISPDDIVHLQTSSGTTGLQKIVPLTHHNVITQIAILSEAIQIVEDDITITWMPLYHDGGLMFGMFLPMLEGLTSVLISPLEWVTQPAMYFDAVDRYKATVSIMPNFGFNHCARRIRNRDIKDISLSSLRLFVNAAERVYWETVMKFHDRFKGIGVKLEALGVGYGMAEATLLVTHTQIEKQIYFDCVDKQALENENFAKPAAGGSDSAVMIASCGIPIRTVEFSIRDNNFIELPDRHVGEVCIRSSSMFSGYYQRPDLTEQYFREGWYLSGDLGYLFDGQLFIAGRKKDLLITGGKNIYPSDIEEIVFKVEGVKPGRAAVFGVFSEKEGTELIAVVAEAYSQDPDEHSKIALRIRQAIAQQSSVVASYVTVTGERWIIKTSSGKIARTANREKWLKELKS